MLARQALRLVALTLLSGLLTSMDTAAQTQKVLELSRTASVRIISQSGKSSGSGFFIGPQHIVTCFHVVAAVGVQGNTVNWKVFPDLQIVLPSGEKVAGVVVSLPKQDDLSPLQYDFAVVKLSSKPNGAASVQLANAKDVSQIGDDVVFSGYPLATPGMVTHRGMVSGFDDSRSIIVVQAPINKGNSGGALMNSQGRVIGIVSMREGGISLGLHQLRVQIDQTASQGSVQFMGVDPLQATKSIIETLDQFISTGIGYARSIRFTQQWLSNNQGAIQ